MTELLTRRAFLAMGATPREPASEAQLDSPPGPQKAEISADCLSLKGVACRICGEHCDAGAIRFHLRVGGTALPEVTADCDGCGACVRVCPAAAISLVEQTERVELA